MSEFFRNLLSSTFVSIRGPVAWGTLGMEARKRIQAGCALPQVMGRYQDLYKELASRTI